jgi:hypothetical protein
VSAVLRRSLARPLGPSSARSGRRRRTREARWHRTPITTQHRPAAACRGRHPWRVTGRPPPRCGFQRRGAKGMEISQLPWTPGACTHPPPAEPGLSDARQCAGHPPRRPPHCTLFLYHEEASTRSHRTESRPVRSGGRPVTGGHQAAVPGAGLTPSAAHCGSYPLRSRKPG